MRQSCADHLQQLHYIFFVFCLIKNYHFSCIAGFIVPQREIVPIHPQPNGKRRRLNIKQSHYRPTSHAEFVTYSKAEDIENLSNNRRIQRNSVLQTNFRTALKKRSQNKCEVTDVSGKYVHLEAAHVGESFCKLKKRWHR